MVTAWKIRDSSYPKMFFFWICEYFGWHDAMRNPIFLCRTFIIYLQNTYHIMEQQG